jgi:hypothetical protein
MMEHTRGWPICCLIAHDTFGSFKETQIVEWVEAQADVGGFGFLPLKAAGLVSGAAACFTRLHHRAREAISRDAGEVIENRGSAD